VEKIFYLFASTEAGEEASGGIFGSLGIDWKVLLLQAIAFGILVFILAKWVYPPILAMLDRREKLIEDSVKAAKEASAKSEKAEAEIAKQLKEARQEAAEIVETSRKESQEMLLNAETDASKRADAIVASARAQLDRDVEAARKTLREDTIELVAMATGKITRSKVDATADAKLIKEAIKDAADGE
jgi:F-type H+-transporting ATPase subunit b